MVDKESLLKKVKELNASEAPNFEVLAKIQFFRKYNKQY